MTPVNPSPGANLALRFQAGIFFVLALSYAPPKADEAKAVDDTLQRLLDAEMRAEKIAQTAEAEQQHIIQAALKEAQAEDERFIARVPDLHRGYIAKAQERAEQTVAELKRRYDERHVQLRNMAEEREGEALAAAFQVLISPEL